MFGDGTDADVVAFADDDLEAAVQVFHVRGGRVRGQRGWIVEKSGEPGESGQGQLVEQFLTQFYGDQAELGGAADESTNPVPREVLVPCLPPNAEELATWLSQLRGSRVALRVPQRGDKRALAETVQRNAQDALHAAQAQARRRLHREIRCAAEYSGRAGPGRCAAAHRMRRHQPRPGHRRGGVAGGVRGRPAAQVRLPPLRDPGGRRRRPLRRRGVHRRGDPAPLLRGTLHDTAARRSELAAGREVAQVRLSAQPVCRRRRRPAGQCGSGGARRARRHRRRGDRAGQTAGGGVGAVGAGSRSSCRATAKGCICCSGCATKHTGSRSPTTAASGPSG